MSYRSGALLLQLLSESRPYARYYVLIAVGFVIASVAGLGIADSLRRLVDAAAQRSTALLWSGILVAEIARHDFPASLARGEGFQGSTDRL